MLPPAINVSVAKPNANEIKAWGGGFMGVFPFNQSQKK